MVHSIPTPVVGTEYVYGSIWSDGETFVPMRCNTEYSPAHPCRVVPTKVGPKWSYAFLSGSDKPKKIATDGLLPIDTAKTMYRATMIGRHGAEGPSAERMAFINQCVDNL